MIHIRWYFGRIGFSVYILTIWFCSAHVNTILGIRAYRPLSHADRHFCTCLSFPFAGLPCPVSSQAQEGRDCVPLPISAETKCRVQHVFVKLICALCFLSFSSSPLLPCGLIPHHLEPELMEQHWALPAPTQSQATVPKTLLSLCSCAQKCSVLPIPHTVNCVIWLVFKGLYKASPTHFSSVTSHTSLDHPTSFNQAALFTNSSAFLSPCLALAISLARTARSPSLTHILPILKG